MHEEQVKICMLLLGSSLEEVVAIRPHASPDFAVSKRTKDSLFRIDGRPCSYIDQVKCMLTRYCGIAGIATSTFSVKPTEQATTYGLLGNQETSN